MRENAVGQIVIGEGDFVDLLLRGRADAVPLVADGEWMDLYRDSCAASGVRDPAMWQDDADHLSVGEFSDRCVSEWFMPDEYRDLDVEALALERCGTEEERERVALEMEMFRERGMDDVLRFLKYFVDRIDKKGLFIGLGRGSSVASHVLYLLGVHRVNPMEHDLPIGEFLKDSKGEPS